MTGASHSAIVDIPAPSTSTTCGAAQTPSGASCFQSPSPCNAAMPTCLPAATRVATAIARRTSTPYASLAQSH